MRIQLLSLLILLVAALPMEGRSETLLTSSYFVRPMSCPLRFSRLTALRDQMQTLVNSFGNGCTQSSQQALAQASASVANLEGIANSWQTYSNTANQNAVNAQFAKNLNQILGSLNTITSNNACFYDMKSRGILPVLGDMITSLSQFGLLIPSAPGMLVASGGYVVGSALKIINELVKKKFNWNKPEERRLFLQLNCAFFDNRRVMEEMGIFNPENENYSQEIEAIFRKERLALLKDQRREEQNLLTLDKSLADSLTSIPNSKANGLNATLAKQLEDLSILMAGKPSDYAAKWQQVTGLSLVAAEVLQGLKNLKLDKPEGPMVGILAANLESMLKDLEPKAKAWTETIDEYEINHRGPLMAFFTPVAKGIRRALVLEEASMILIDPAASKRIADLRINIKQSNTAVWALGMRITSLDAKINSLELDRGTSLFSSSDEGKSDTVEILEYYRKLQASILGKEGRGYIVNSLESSEDMKESLEIQIMIFDQSKGNKREFCSAAEKLRFAWAQYRAKVQESFDFASTNFDLYRSTFKVGKQKIKRAQEYVLQQIESVEGLDRKIAPEEETIGHMVSHVKGRLNTVEKRLRDSGCFNI